jgi:cyclohexadieny/prephenate dehydrogenase / 3-phosphoshikimate 1-carboxyvinyltransferase
VSAADSYLVRPANAVHGKLTVPGDKSISHRALMFGAIATGTTHVDGFLAGEDCLSTLAALRALGVRIEQPATTEVIIHGVGRDGLQASTDPLDMGNAGTAMRLFAGLLAGQRFDSTLIGDASLMRRPMERVAAPLRLMGASISTEDGHAPVRVRGGASLRGIDYALPVASAQIKSAILLAGLHASGTTRISESAPTRDHTERMLGSFGVRVERQGSAISLTGGQTLRSCDVTVPGDFSSAAFFLVAGAIGATESLTLCNVGMNPTRTGLLELLRLMGADIRVQELPDCGAEPTANLTVRAAPLRGIKVPPEMVPLAIDEFPAFFIAAAAATGETQVTGAAELRVKESDRLAVMAEGLSALGIHCELLSDGIKLQGGPMHGGVVRSHADHRIAMAFAIASLRASAPIRIEAVANVATSFPGFAATARHIGLDLVD